MVEILLLPQVKRSVIITNKTVYASCYRGGFRRWGGSVPTQEKKKLVAMTNAPPPTPNIQESKTKLNGPHAPNRQRPATPARAEIKATTHSTRKTRKTAPLKAKPPAKSTYPAPKAEARGQKRCLKIHFTQKIHHDPRPAPPPNNRRQTEASRERNRMKTWVHPDTFHPASNRRPDHDQPPPPASPPIPQHHQTPSPE